MPLEVGRKQDALGRRVYAAGHADADAFKGLVCVAGAEEGDLPDDAVHGGLSVGDGHDGFTGEKAAAEIDDGEDGSIGPEVQGEGDDGVVDGEHDGGAAARALDDCALADPAFFNQLLDDGSYGAGLEAGELGEIDAGDGLTETDELKDDIAVDLPGDLAGGELDGGEIDPANTMCAAHSFQAAPLVDLFRDAIISLGET